MFSVQIETGCEDGPGFVSMSPDRSNEAAMIPRKQDVDARRDATVKQNAAAGTVLKQLY